MTLVFSSWVRGFERRRFVGRASSARVLADYSVTSDSFLLYQLA
jgi:hypothetical protein